MNVKQNNETIDLEVKHGKDNAASAEILNQNEETTPLRDTLKQLYGRLNHEDYVEKE